MLQCYSDYANVYVANSRNFTLTGAIQREQKNDLTAFIDASNVYGSSLEEQATLRDGG